MRVAALVFFFVGTGLGQKVPAWFNDSQQFCSELSRRTSPQSENSHFGKPQSVRFTDFPARVIAPQRREAGILGKYDWTDEKSFASKVKAEASKGPDFAGRYAILTWSCGSWCANATVADVRTGKTYDTPFVGVIGCRGVTGDLDTLERKANSSLLIVRGSLEMTFSDGSFSSFTEGPCGIFYFRWVPNSLQLIGCDIQRTSSQEK